MYFDWKPLPSDINLLVHLSLVADADDRLPVFESCCTRPACSSARRATRPTIRASAAMRRAVS